MATIFTRSNIAVRVYANDHLPPHFHVVTPEREVLILISDLSVHRGEISAATRRRVWDWIETNRGLIAAEWNRLNPRFPIA